MRCLRRLLLVPRLLHRPGQPLDRARPHFFRQSCDALTPPSALRSRADANPIFLFIYNYLYQADGLQAAVAIWHMSGIMAGISGVGRGYTRMTEVC